MADEFITTRVTNPAPQGSSKMNAAQKKAFAARMKRARAAKAGRTGNPKRRTRKRSTALTHRRKSRSIRRRRNPMELGGIALKPALIQSAGIAAGTYIGTAVTDFVDQSLVSLLPASLQASGYAAGAVGMVVLGEWLQKKAKDIPVVAIAVATSVPMWIKFFQATGLMAPSTYVADAGAATSGMGMWPFKRRMRGSLQVGRMPGMAGTIHAGNIPGAMVGTTGAFGALIN